MSNSESEVEFILDNQKIRVPKGTTIFHAAKERGIELPIFCYQERLPPFGACRVCLVEVEKMGKLQTSCTLEAKEGMVVHTQSERAKMGREGILEFLLINHPLDCPICDKGGECPLQDQALDFGPGKSRFFEEKRHFTKPYPLTPVLMLDRERCILCARCTRFSDELAGDGALQMVDRGYKCEVGTAGEEKLDFKFIGNTISICPVGALTSQVYRFRARPWDNAQTSTSCTLCPMGCEQLLDTRNGQIVRTRAKEDRAVNDIWMCDKGWFGYEYTSHPERLLHPLRRKGEKLEPVSWEEALDFFAEALIESLSKKRIAGFGGMPLTCEENYLFQELVRKGFGVPHIDYRIGVPIFSMAEEGYYGSMDLSFQECERVEVILLLGFDVTEEFPVLWLRLRQALNKGAKAIFIGHFAPEVARYIDQTHLHPPLEEVSTLEKLEPSILSAIGNKHAALFVGNQYLASKNRHEILSYIETLEKKSPSLRINIMEGKNNSHGARYAGVHPELAPGGLPIEEMGLNALEVMKEASTLGWDLLYVVGANPAQSFPLALWQAARHRLKTLVVQDLFLTETALAADLVLPALSAFEKSGTFINVERRTRTLNPAREAIPKGLRSDGELFQQVAERLGHKLVIPNTFFDSLLQSHLPRCKTKAHNVNLQPHSAPKGLRLSLAKTLYSEGVRMTHNPHLRSLAQEPTVRIHPKEAEKRGLATGEVIYLQWNGMKIAATLKVDSTVSENTLVVPIGYRSLPIHQLGSNLLTGIEVEIMRGSSHE